MTAWERPEDRQRRLEADGTVADTRRRSGITPTSSFPLDAFPAWLKEHVESVTHRLQVSADMPAVFALPVMAAAVGRALRVRAWRGFEQPVVVWTVVAAASGENKSAVVNAMKGPVIAYQRERKKREKPDHDDASRRYELLKKQADSMAAQAVKSQAKVTMAEAESAMREADEAKPNPLFRLTFDSATTEALVNELALHTFLAHLEGEGDLFTDIVGRYDSGGLLKQYLDGYDGEGIDLDRVGRGHISAEQALIVLGVMIQPDMLAGVMGEGSFKGRGLLERCLYAMPPTLVGTRDMRAQEGNRDAEEAYARRLSTLCEKFHEPEPELPGRVRRTKVLELSAEAREVFVSYRQRIEARLRADLTPIISWVNKAQGGTVLRLAALLAVAWDSDAVEVDGPTMSRAVEVMERFFIPQALRTFGDLRGDAAGHVEKQIEPWLRNQTGVFTARDLQRSRGDLFPSADAARGLLNQLAEDGRLECVERPRSSRSGPKPEKGYRQVRQSRRVAADPRNTQDSERKRETEPVDDLSDSSDLSEGVTP